MEALILSNALDTNGQNARFVEAARKLGKDKAVLQALAVGNADPAGVVGRYRLAAEKYGGLVIREAHRASAYFDFPHDIIWSRRTEHEIGQLAKRADIIHLNNSDAAYRHFHLTKKPALLHHHGSLFRKDPAHMFRVAHQFRMTQAVSTIDLTRPDPDALHWLPTAYDLDALAALRKAHKRKVDGRVRIVHCPTNRVLKATSLLILTVRELQKDGLPVDLVLVEGKKWADAMAEKAQADIVFDQLAFGYGCNAVEAWGMGIPVIAGADDWTLERMRSEWGGLPFYESSEASLRDAIRTLVESKDARAEWAERGEAHVERYHAERPALERLAELYEKTIAHFGSKAAQRAAEADPVTFRNTRGRPVYVDGERVQFVDGEVTLRDPLAIEWLRKFAARRNYGIVEVREDKAA